MSVKQTGNSAGVKGIRSVATAVCVCQLVIAVTAHTLMVRELNQRVDRVQAQMAAGTLPGFEGFSAQPPVNGPYVEQVTKNIKQGVLIEMYLEQQFKTDMARITEAMELTEPQ